MTQASIQRHGLESIGDARGLLAGLFEYSPVAFQIYQADGHCLLVNQAFRELFGTVPPPEYNVLEDEIAERDGLLGLIHRAFAGETIRIPGHWYDARELRRVNLPEGRRVGIEVTLFPLRDVGGGIQHVALCFKEVTAELEQRAMAEALERSTADLQAEVAERKRIEYALRASEENLATTLNSIGDAVIATDTEGRVTQMNPVAEALTGWAFESARGKELSEVFRILSEESGEPVPSPMDRVIREGVMVGLANHTVLVASDGVSRAIAVSGAPIRDARGVLRGVVLVFRDQSAERRAARALEVSEARFRHLAESGIIGIIITDTLGSIYEANDAFLRMVGYEREELTSGRVRWVDITPPEWHALDEAAIVELQATGAARPWQKEYQRKDGTRVPVLVGVAQLEPPRGIAFVLDLSEQKRAEEVGIKALRVAKQESAQRERAEVALRETEDQLRQSQKMEAVGRLAGGVAHDFNNLLSVILSYAEMLLPTVDAADPMHADLEQIALAGRRANDLTRQLLAFSRQQVLRPRLVNLNEAISGMTKMLRRIIGEDVELVLLPAPKLGTVHVDPGQIEQVLLNLIVNARDAMPTGGKLTIETTDVELDRPHAAGLVDIEAGRYVLLSVSDTGMGMNIATKSRIFEPFFTTKEKGKGTGLGLSTVFGIVKQSGGGISVYSQEGRGATFKIYLPRMDAAAELNERATPQRATMNGAETVLLVEDNEQVRTLAVKILSSHGYNVLEATSGGDAILMCEQYQGHIHLLLTDVVMPRMGGRQLWERLAPLRPTMKVLFMSGYTDDAIVHHGVSSSELAFIQKPFVPGHLLAKLRGVLDATG